MSDRSSMIEYMRLYRQGLRRPRTSKRPKEAAALKAQGLSIPEIAKRMNLEPITIKGYLYRARRRAE